MVGIIYLYGSVARNAVATSSSMLLWDHSFPSTTPTLAIEPLSSGILASQSSEESLDLIPDSDSLSDIDEWSEESLDSEDSCSSARLDAMFI